MLTWFPVNDLDGMMQVMGGREKTIQRLNEQFERAAPQHFRFGWLQYDNNTGFHHAHLFNLLDSRGAIAVAERQGYIGRIRDLCKACALAWVASESAG